MSASGNGGDGSAAHGLFLERLVAAAEDGLNLTVTLLVSGAVVRGVTISSREYYENTRAQLACAFSPDHPVQAWIEAAVPRSDRIKLTLESVYLKDVRVLGTNGSIPSSSAPPVPACEVRLAEVSAWWLGYHVSEAELHQLGLHAK